jgi:hypothetical protein
MLIFARIPVEKIEHPGWYTFREEVLEVEVVLVLRSRADSTRDRFYYQAHVIPPPGICPKAINYLGPESVYPVNIVRKLNPKWKPPVFPEGVNKVEIQGRQA